MKDGDLLGQAKAVLERNDNGNWTQAALDMYPNQWFWDSCFIAIGLSHYKPERAIRELRSICAGQWDNGMIPNEVFHHDHQSGSRLWRSEVSPQAPPTIKTSGITQPPLLAEAVWRIGERLTAPKRNKLFEEFYPKLVAYHTWLYTERNPHHEGLVVLLHPWETGTDDTPPWITELHTHWTPFWISLIGAVHADKLIDLIRQDLQSASIEQRMSTMDALRLYNIVVRMRRKKYQTNLILKHGLFAIEDLFFNSILIRNNQILEEIAKTIRRQLPRELHVQMTRAALALDDLWDEQSEQYYSQNFVTDEKLRVPTIAALMPLYSRAITHERAKKLVHLLKNRKEFWTTYPVPSVPLSSTHFREIHYWSGPVWLNTNWLLADGLRHYGYDDIAQSITTSSLALVEKSGFREYFSPLDGSGAGATNFSWTAALIIDMLAHNEPAAVLEAKK
ncbi:MAG TPA: trehalase family glycosidase [Candidatus Saccharimonadales bacterium]|nr:trehalase family glycosidase [Candidatus Saccharimonadales bacterium]